jgi:hypothetical protein
MNIVADRIVKMESMSTSHLRETYAELFGEETNSCNWKWLFRRCAWRVQALAEGTLSIRAKRRAQELVNDADIRVIPPRNTVPDASGPKVANDAMALNRDKRLPMPGTTLKRLFKDTEYFVKVLPNGFEYRSNYYRSLSAVAYAITGNHWNGYNFFKASLEYTKENQKQ